MPARWRPFVPPRWPWRSRRPLRRQFGTCRSCRGRRATGAVLRKSAFGGPRARSRLRTRWASCRRVSGGTLALFGATGQLGVVSAAGRAAGCPRRRRSICCPRRLPPPPPFAPSPPPSPSPSSSAPSSPPVSARGMPACWTSGCATSTPSPVSLPGGVGGALGGGGDEGDCGERFHSLSCALPSSGGSQLVLEASPCGRGGVGVACRASSSSALVYASYRCSGSRGVVWSSSVALSSG